MSENPELAMLIVGLGLGLIGGCIFAIYMDENTFINAIRKSGFWTKPGGGIRIVGHIEKQKTDVWEKEVWPK